MYEKNLVETVRLRLSSVDMDFLRDLSNNRSVSVSECIRSIIGEYRRSLQTLDVLSQALILANNEVGRKLSNGDTKADIDHKL